MTDTTNPTTGAEEAAAAAAKDAGTAASAAKSAAEAPTAGPDDAGDGAVKELTLDEAKAEIARVRKEAARYRTERNELKPLAEQAQAAEDAKKSELEKAQERIAALEAEKREAEQSAARAAVAATTGVPAEFIHGDTEEQMQEYAQRLAEAMGKKPTLPHVAAVGRSGEVPNDRDAFARGFFGRNT